MVLVLDFFNMQKSLVSDLILFFLPQDLFGFVCSSFAWARTSLVESPRGIIEVPYDRAYPLVNLFGPGGLSRFSTVLYHYLRPGVDREIADFPITPVKSGFTLFRHIIRDT